MNYFEWIKKQQQYCFNIVLPLDLAPKNLIQRIADLRGCYSAGLNTILDLYNSSDHTQPIQLQLIIANYSVVFDNGHSYTFKAKKTKYVYTCSKFPWKPYTKSMPVFRPKHLKNHTFYRVAHTYPSPAS